MRVSFKFEEALEFLDQDEEYLYKFSTDGWSVPTRPSTEAASTAIDKAVICKHEHFLCLTLADPDNRKYQDRLRQFTADLSGSLKRPWTSACWPKLVQEVTEAMNTGVRPASSAASSAAVAPGTPAFHFASTPATPAFPAPGTPPGATPDQAPQPKSEKKKKKDKKEKADKKEKKEKKKEKKDKILFA